MCTLPSREHLPRWWNVKPAVHIRPTAFKYPQECVFFFRLFLSVFAQSHSTNAVKSSKCGQASPILNFHDMLYYPTEENIIQQADQSDQKHSLPPSRLLRNVSAAETDRSPLLYHESKLCLFNDAAFFFSLSTFIDFMAKAKRGKTQQW